MSLFARTSVRLLLCCLSLTSLALLAHSQLLPQLEFDDARHLASNYILHRNSSHCQEKVANMWTENNRYAHSREIVALSETELLALSILNGDNSASNSSDQSCVAVCVNVGTAEQHLHSPLPYLIYTEASAASASADRRQLLDWNRHCREAEVSVISFIPDTTLSLVWIDTANPGRNSTLLEVKRTSQWLKAQLGHQLLVLNTLTKGVVLNFTVAYSTEVVLGKEFIEEESRKLPPKSQNMSGSAVSSWAAKEAVGRTFSPLGFAKGSVPPDVWASISAYYHNNKRHYHNEPEAAVVVNGRQQQTQFLNMPHEMKRYWQSRLRELVETWIGGETPLENTFIYGIRRYGAGARLMPHVDRIRTHAVSLIINVAQEGMQQPWSLEVFDFAGRLHAVNLQPGELVFYESAKVVHSRAKPMRGQQFANIFAHYRPIVPTASSLKWFEQPNPTHTPAPIIDLVECEEHDKRPGVLGGGFTCDGVEMPFLISPKPVVTTVDEMVQFWEQFNEDNGHFEQVAQAGAGQEL
mmetsp:Transcript_21451/g.36112  ORF Transcript_21451/g.36112 Transcript_21451/m.36112 type:complete len:523 (-) Transcript_21451:203-1771(-)